MLFYSLRTGCAGGGGGQALNETVFNLMKYFGSFVVAQRNIIKARLRGINDLKSLAAIGIFSLRNCAKF